jgi:L-seryl-tRNA(Ser) seleniumtransferase
MASGADRKNRGKETANLLRALPSVDRLLRTNDGEIFVAKYGRLLTVESLRQVLENKREAILTAQDEIIAEPVLLADVQTLLEKKIQLSLKAVINASGVVIHTNLGRAPIGEEILRAAQSIGAGYSNLEYDLSQGKRGSRAVHAEELLKDLTGAEAALVVNNNAAAILLMLAALCQGQEVLISRGQLIEIGGGFRLPDIMAASGVELVEVGATNRTHIADYERAIGPKTAAILVAHHSNFKIIGFSEEPALGIIAKLAHEHGLLLLYDQGSGALLNTESFGLTEEPTVSKGLDAGADLVAFSGDKLLGGPQAGILCGRKRLVETLRNHPLARAVRADKLGLAVLSSTLVSYLTGSAVEEIPVWQMISRPLLEIEDTANRWAAIFQKNNLPAKVVDGESTIGGGSLPGATLPTKLVALDHDNVESLAAILRKTEPPVVSRIGNNLLLLDPRTVLPGQESTLISAVLSGWRRLSKNERINKS